MKDSLKDFVDKNRDAFDDQEPSERIWSGISVSLPVIKKVRTVTPLILWRAAAVLFLGLSVYFFITREPASRIKKEQTNDFADLESFYRKQIAEKAKLINDFEVTGESDPFTQDFQKLDAMYQVLGEEMKNHPDEKVKDAMILNLLVKVDLLNQQLKKLEDARNKKRAGKSSEV